MKYFIAFIEKYKNLFRLSTIAKLFLFPAVPFKEIRVSFSPYA